MNQTYETNLLRTKAQRAGPWAASVQVCRNMAAKFNQLRDRIMERLAVEVRGVVPEEQLQRAVTEAEALAWTTPFPVLFLPVLAEEKVANARQWADRQRAILRRQNGW